MHEMADKLARGFISDFWAANHEMRWHLLETEHLTWLSSNTALVGKIDAIGETPDGRPFFGDWKSASKGKKHFIVSEKAGWRMKPQSLTYGVLLGLPPRGRTTGDSEVNALAQPVKSFTVRWAFKTDPVTTDFAWYTYSDAELDWWRGQLLEFAEEIRTRRKTGKWPTNLNHCSRYNNYPCKFRDGGCWQLNFNYIPDNHHPRLQSHLQIENNLRAHLIGNLEHQDELVVLDASRVDDFCNCRFLYNRKWEGDGLTEESEDLQIGHDFHAIIAAHLTQIANQSRIKTSEKEPSV